jgi:hypothetical protein
MRTGKLAISRGHSSTEPPRLILVPAQNEPAPEPAPVRHDLVEHRLTSLERLTRLYEQGVLTVDEFIDEKALILGRRPAEHVEGAAPVHFVPAAPRAPRRGPSLVGRMLGWRFVLLSLAIGIGFSFAIQPDITSRFFAQTFHALGG